MGEENHLLLAPTYLSFKNTTVLQSRPVTISAFGAPKPGFLTLTALFRLLHSVFFVHTASFSSSIAYLYYACPAAMAYHHPGKGPHLHLGELTNDSISSVAPFSGLILTVTCCVIALVRLYILEPLIPKVYPRGALRDITITQRRSFTNHHIAAVTKVLLVILCGYPLLAIMCGGATPHTSYANGSLVTLGDVMIVSSQIFTGMYIFELFYRDKVSVISCAHHVGAIVIAQSAIAMSINSKHERAAVYELVLCFIWGKFHF